MLCVSVCVQCRSGDSKNSVISMTNKDQQQQQTKKLIDKRRKKNSIHTRIHA